MISPLVCVSLSYFWRFISRCVFVVFKCHFLILKCTHKIGHNLSLLTSCRLVFPHTIFIQSRLNAWLGVLHILYAVVHWASDFIHYSLDASSPYLNQAEWESRAGIVTAEWLTSTRRKGTGNAGHTRNIHIEIDRRMLDFRIWQSKWLCWSTVMIIGGFLKYVRKNFGPLDKVMQRSALLASGPPTLWYPWPFLGKPVKYKKNI